MSISSSIHTAIIYASLSETYCYMKIFYFFIFLVTKKLSYYKHDENVTMVLLRLKYSYILEFCQHV